MTQDFSPASWTKGLLPFLVMNALSKQGAHGYAIAQQLSTEGIGPVKGGTLYPVLNRLEVEGTIAGTWTPGVAGPGRKSFSLTEAGRRRLVALSADWTKFSAAVDRFTNPAETIKITDDTKAGGA